MNKSLGLRALRRIQKLTPEELADALDQNGFSGCRQLVIDKEIDGNRFINLTEIELKRYKHVLRLTELNRLWLFISKIKEHPEEFVLSDPEYLNYNQAPPRKPAEVPKPAPAINAPKPKGLNVTKKPGFASSLSNAPVTKPAINPLKPNRPPSFKSQNPAPLINSRTPIPPPLKNSTKPNPSPPFNSPKPNPPPPFNSPKPKPPPLINTPKPLINSPLNQPKQLIASTKPNPPPLIITPPATPINNQPKPKEHLSQSPHSPAVDLVESLRNNLKEKFKNAFPEYEDSIGSNSTEWSDEDVLPNESPEESINVQKIEEENERERKKSAELFNANKLKVALLLKGVRDEDTKNEPIYVNIQELHAEESKLEHENARPPAPPKRNELPPPIPPQKSEQISERKKSIAMEDVEERPPMPPKRVESPARKFNHDNSFSNNSLPKPPKLHDDHTNTLPGRKKLHDELTNTLPGRKLPQPPSHLPNLKLETTLIDLTKPPQRPPKTRSSLETKSESNLNVPKFISEPNLANDIYEPPPNVEFIPKNLEPFIGPTTPRVPAKNKFEAPIDDSGYLITNDLIQSNDSLFSKQKVPLPPIPIKADLNHTVQLQRNDYFQNITDREIASKLMESKPTGYFLLRPSKRYFCTMMIKGERKIYNVPILYQDYHFRLLTNEDEASVPEEFETLDDLIEYYISNVFKIKNTDILLRRKMCCM